MANNKLEWVQHIEEGLIQFLYALQIPEQPGRFLPCLQGLKLKGRNAALGFSCFALKLYYMLGLWEALDEQTQESWIAFLNSFQVRGKNWQHRVLRNAFIDPVVITCLKQKIPRYQRFMHDYFFSSNMLTLSHKIIIAETKQTIATLIQVGASSGHPYLGFPQIPEDVQNRILGLNWSHPWEAGGQASAIAIFLKTEAPRVLSPPVAQELVNTCCRAFETLVDRKTGAYFTGSLPEHGELMNGAMKVLTALDWLDAPIHYPEQLIDTCLVRLPSSEGCHLVDAVYVLYRCLQYTQHRKDAIQAYCLNVLEMIKQHHNADGGFSYYIGRSQKSYYGVPISEGFAESDIHGTILLTWTLVMICEILDGNDKHWKVIKP